MDEKHIEYTALATLLLSLAVVVGSHAGLIVLSFRGGRRRGLLALAIPPVAWISPFLDAIRPRQRCWAGVCLGGLLLASAAFGLAAAFLVELNHGLGVVEGFAGGGHR